MYICNNCGAIFETPSIYEEHHPYGMGYATEYLAVCPHCQSYNFDEAKQCERCGELVAELHNGLCDCCHSDLYD